MCSQGANLGFGFRGQVKRQRRKNRDWEYTGVGMGMGCLRPIAKGPGERAVSLSQKKIWALEMRILEHSSTHLSIYFPVFASAL